MVSFHALAEAAIAFLLVIGGVFSLVGVIGMLRFPDFYMRLHAPTKAVTLGLGGVLAASLVHDWSRGEVGLYELLIAIFFFLTAPVAANLLGAAALHLRTESRCGPPSTGGEGSGS
jgi:multicomponent K+:H+ antiporter subunit G